MYVYGRKRVKDETNLFMETWNRKLLHTEYSTIDQDTNVRDTNKDDFKLKKKQQLLFQRFCKKKPLKTQNFFIFGHFLVNHLIHRTF